eukprot:CFRG3425T1
MKVDTVVIGAGVVGLAVARKLARVGKEVIVLERNAHIGMETSSRNSQVIHAGLYYPKDSLKARLCVTGRQKLYQYCLEKSIPHSRIGKLIVATEESERPAINRIVKNAQMTGVDDLVLLNTRDAVRMQQSDINAVAGLYSPSTGIIDSHSLMLSLLGDLEEYGGSVAYNTLVTAGDGLSNCINSKRAIDKTLKLSISPSMDGQAVNDVGEMTVEAKYIVNAAGLEAPSIAKRIVNQRMEQGIVLPEARYCKGNYYSLHGRHPFKHLIYPIPDEAGLGVHATLNLAGQVTFGPDTEWISHIDYNVNDNQKGEFLRAIKRYWPGVIDADISPSYSGIRPKIVSEYESAADFMILGPRETGGNVVHLLGIESPGLTASLAIADHVAGLLKV